MWFESTIPTISDLHILLFYYSCMVRENNTTFYMNMSNTGYKAMLRDRIPLVANLALLWTNSKTAWVNHVYKHFISIYADNEERKNATRILLGLKKNFSNTLFCLVYLSNKTDCVE